MGGFFPDGNGSGFKADLQKKVSYIPIFFFIFPFLFLFFSSL